MAALINTTNGGKATAGSKGGNLSAMQVVKEPESGKAPNVVCFYHYPCTDGAFAALAAHMALSAQHSMTFYPYSHASSIEYDMSLFSKTTRVYFLDNCGNKELLTKVCMLSDKVCVLDHHKTSEKDMKEWKEKPENLEVLFDMARSGAMMAWDFFEPQVNHCAQIEGDRKTSDVTNELHTVFRYVQDRDLWTFELPASKEFTLGLQSLNIAYDARRNPNLFQELAAVKIGPCIARGVPLLARQRQVCQEHVERAHYHSFSNGDRYLVVFTEASVDTSELGNAMACASDTGLAMVLRRLGSDQKAFRASLRSIKTADTTPTARLFGGGGHKCASGCNVPRHIFGSNIVDKNMVESKDGMRAPGNTCNRYFGKGVCSFGSSCKFNHDKLAPGVTAPSASGTSSSGTFAAPGVPNAVPASGSSNHFGASGSSRQSMLLRRAPGNTCNQYFSSSRCFFGESCKFQHDMLAPGVDERKTVWRTKKPRPCNQFVESGMCSFGERCHFGHDSMPEPTFMLHGSPSPTKKRTVSQAGLAAADDAAEAKKNKMDQ